MTLEEERGKLNEVAVWLTLGLTEGGLLTSTERSEAGGRGGGRTGRTRSREEQEQ